MLARHAHGKEAAGSTSAAAAAAAASSKGSSVVASAAARSGGGSTVTEEEVAEEQDEEERRVLDSEEHAAAAAAGERAHKSEGDALASYVSSRGGKRVLRKVLVANNGMAAAKCIMSLRRWSFLTFGDERALHFVAMATPEDLNANSEYIRHADEYVQVPGGANANNYANVQLIVDIAVRENVDCVWPGWGHASENPKLPDALRQRGIAFVGPPAGVMAVLGDKIAANILAQTADVPSIPWSGDGLRAELEGGKVPSDVFDAAMVHSVEEAVSEAERIGYPVMLKASEGGGGKGIRKSNTEAELRSNYDQVKAEVPGSPVFMMQLCTQARHLEVQIVGDEYGHAVALNGRDCSTQRRFQKIFEEGPPTIARPDVFKQMEKAAQRLTQSIGYVGAGTVEFLYNAASADFYFLELNPRLQVEHPVTEGITGINLPATQLQVAMGIPLNKIPDVRAFYGRERSGESPIDFMEEDYELPKRHVIAARITAENPDEGFKPTSGSIERISFQSSPDVWGYFSVGANGGVHEFADSQFGHVFATGTNREEARKALLIALKELVVRGEIRTAVEYLVKLLETDDFRQNSIDTSWLDSLIANKDITIDHDATSIVACAAVYRAYSTIQSAEAEIIEALGKGQRNMEPLIAASMQFGVEVVYENVRYDFTVRRTGHDPRGGDMLRLDVGDSSIDARVREQADGTLLTTIGGVSRRISGVEEPLGLRLVINGSTNLLQNTFDPSELRTDVTGKVLRFLQPDGAQIEKGEPFAEMEAMKMVMPVIATESGAITRACAEGGIVEAGDLLATLELKDPTKVKKIERFSGSFYASTSASSATAVAQAAVNGTSANGGGAANGSGEDESLSFSNPLQALQSAEKRLRYVLAGYDGDADDEIQNLLAALGAPQLFASSLLDAVAVIGNKMPSAVEEALPNIRDADGLTKLLAAHPEHSAVLTPVRNLAERFQGGTLAHALRVVASILDTFTQTESLFSGRSHDDAIAHLLESYPNDMTAVVAELRAHAALPARSQAVLALLHQLPTLPQRCGSVNSSSSAEMLPEVVDALERLSALKGREYGSVVLAATHMLFRRRQKPFAERLRELRDILAGKSGMVRSWGTAEPGNIRALIESPTLAVDLLPALFSDTDPEINVLSREVYVRRMYSAHNILSMSAEENGVVKWKFRFMDTAKEESPLRHGTMVVLDNVESLRSRLPSLIEDYRRDIADSHGESMVEVSDPVNVFHAVLTAEESGDSKSLVPTIESILAEHAEAFRDMKMRMFNVISMEEPERPHYHTFTHCQGYKEDPLRRNMRPTFWHLLELKRLQDYETERLPTANRDFHIYLATPQEEGEPRRQLQFLFFRRISHSKDFTSGGCERIIGKALDALQLAMKEPKVSNSASSRIFINILPAFRGELDATLNNLQEILSDYIARNAPRLVRLRVDEIEVKGRVLTPTSVVAQPVRVMATSMTGKWLEVEAYHEYADPINGVCKKFWNGEMCFLEPYRIASGLESRRARCRAIGTTYAYDFLGLLEKALVQVWESAAGPMPRQCFSSVELVTDTKSQTGLKEVQRVVGTNDVGMLAWRVTMKTPEYPQGREVVVIANDITHASGSFGLPEDDFFQLASQYAEERGVPRVYVSCNSGARIGLIDEVKPLFKVAWRDAGNPSLGFDYLYLEKRDLDSLPTGCVNVEEIHVEGEDEARLRIVDIIGEDRNMIGVENLRGSGKIAGVTSRAYRNIFTLSYVTGRSVGIGAYLCRLGQRVIQMANGPLILTGYGALNKLLGRRVYTSQDQLGGQQVMLPNGVSHLGVEDDQQGAEQILRWLSYVPKDVHSGVPTSPNPIRHDPVSRDIGFIPTKTPYDPRHMLAGTKGADGEWLGGFFDRGSFTETLGGWGKSVVCGRAKLGGIPMGVIAVETRLTETRIPADPANPDSREGVAQQAGQVWFPDSAYKTAQCIADFNNGEQLPLMIFANWRGFSGGTRDMANEILKYGAMIVDALREYRQPVFVYIPPGGELRGGAWVVIDPTINEERMEMFADVDSRGGILEPPGVCEVKFREGDQRRAMHRLDPLLSSMDREERDERGEEVRQRESLLGPLYMQIAHEFADLHDRSGRMKAKGVISEALSWPRSREYFYWHLRRRLAEDELVSSHSSSGIALDRRDVISAVETQLREAGVDVSDDRAVLSFLETKSESITSALDAIHRRSVTSTIQQLVSTMPPEAVNDLLGELQH